MRYCEDCLSHAMNDMLNFKKCLFNICRKMKTGC